MRLGNGLWEHTSFNSRLQPTQIGLGTSQTDAGVLRLDYTYGLVVGGVLDTTKNNGNVQSQTITVPGVAQPFVQSYVYDELNRLSSAQEMNAQISATTPTWKQSYSYDQFGNRTLKTGTTYPAPLDTINNPAVSPSNNRVTSAGYSYDEAGNLTRMPVSSQASHDLAYDAENRQARVDGGAGVGGTDYSYDGDGHRVKKASGAVVTVFVYDAAGRVVAEYDNDQHRAAATATSYVTADQLGSTRVVTGQSQEVKGRHDYFPFGEEIPADATWRTAARGYGAADGVRQKFTGKERDDETRLDYFGARYYSSSVGRFTSCDPVNLSSEHIADPQRWNQYAYVENDPLKLVDPNGNDGTGQDGKKTITVFLNYAKEELNAGQYDRTGKFIKQADLPKPNWDALVKDAPKYGYELNVIYTHEGRLHLKEFQSAAEKSDLVVAAGHTGANSETGEKSILLNEDSGIKDPSDGVFYMFTNDKPLDFNAKAFAYFGCNSDALPADKIFNPGNPSAQYIGVKDVEGTGFDSVPSNNWAAYKFVEAYMKSSGNLKIAGAAAQKVYKDSNASIPVEGKRVFVDKLDQVTSRPIR